MSYFASTDRYNQMKYNRCGNSGLKLPAVSLGLWHNFGDMDDQKSIMVGFHNNEIDHIPFRKVIKLKKNVDPNQLQMVEILSV